MPSGGFAESFIAENDFNDDKSYPDTYYGENRINDYSDTYINNCMRSDYIDGTLSYCQSVDTMKKFAKMQRDGFHTNDISRFLSKDANLKAKATHDGRIIVEGIKLNIPDLAKEYETKFKKKLAEYKELNCNEKIQISRWNKGFVLIIAILAFFIFVLCIWHKIWSYMTS